MSGFATGRGGVSIKTVAGFVLVVIALGALTMGLVRQRGMDRADAAQAAMAQPAQDPAAQPEPAQDPPEAAVLVYYLHGDVRCPTCVAIESRTKRILEERFFYEIQYGMLRFEAINYDRPESRHYAADYELAFPSVVIQAPGAGGRWENLADVWTLIHDPPHAMEAYLVERITPMLDEAG